MEEAWTTTISLVTQNFQLLALLAGIFFFLPSVAINMIMPDLAAFFDPAVEPDELSEQLLRLFEENFWAISGVVALSLLTSFVGYLAMVALVGRNRPTVGQAIAGGFQGFATLVGCLILFVILYVLISMAIMLPLAMLGAVGVGAIVLLAPIVILAVIGFLMTRLCVTMPVIMVEGRLNPFAVMWRSWQLTGPSKWPIFGFWALLFVAYLVIALLTFGSLGVIAAVLGDGDMSLFIVGALNGLVGAAVSIVVACISVAIHNQLAGPRTEALEETFS